MPVNALAPPSRNSLLAERQQQLLREAANYPQYGETVDYLAARRMMPPINVEFGATPSFSYNLWGNDLPRTGVVKMPLTGRPASLVHELTHAADAQLDQQYSKIRKKRDLSPLEAQFKQAYEKLAFNPNYRLIDDIRRTPRTQLAAKLDRNWTVKNIGYRATDKELPAWGVASTIASSRSSDYNSPMHLDPTMATEFSILMDLGNRLQRQQPPQGR